MKPKTSQKKKKRKLITLSSVQKLIDVHIEDLQKLSVKSLSVFGSVVRGEATTASDIDFLVEFVRPVGMFDFLEVKYFLESLFKKEIDIATPNALHPLLKDNIMKEAVRVA